MILIKGFYIPPPPSLPKAMILKFSFRKLSGIGEERMEWKSRRVRRALQDYHCERRKRQRKRKATIKIPNILKLTNHQKLTDKTKLHKKKHFLFTQPTSTHTQTQHTHIADPHPPCLVSATHRPPPCKLHRPSHRALALGVGESVSGGRNGD